LGGLPPTFRGIIGPGFCFSTAVTAITFRKEIYLAAVVTR